MSRRWVIAIVLLLLAFALPFGVGGVALLLEPPAYEITAEPGPQWARQVLPSGVRVQVLRQADSQAARRTARYSAEAVASVRSSQALGTYRFRTAADVHGFITAVGPYVVMLQGESRESVDEAIVSLPFLKSGDGRMMRLLENHLLAVIAGLFAYALALIVLSARLLAWAARKAPLPGHFAMDESMLRQHLLKAAQAGITPRTDKNGDLLFEDIRPFGRRVLRLRMDAHRHVVRGTLTTTGKSGGGLSASFHKSRTMPLTGWSAQVGEAVRQAGWTWQPVFTFMRWLGG